MSKAVSSLSKSLNGDPQWQAFVDTKAIIEPVTMGIQSTGSDEAILVTVDAGSKTSASTGPASKADFVLRAQPEQWEKFFDANPVAPYTSFVGLQVRNQTVNPFSSLVLGHTKQSLSSCLSKDIEPLVYGLRD